jgi:hypothetical protein
MKRKLFIVGTLIAGMLFISFLFTIALAETEGRQNTGITGRNNGILPQSGVPKGKEILKGLAASDQKSPPPESPPVYQPPLWGAPGGRVGGGTRSLGSSTSHAVQSTITEAEGYACMGYDKSRKVTEDEALANAKRVAVEYASTYIKSETKVQDAILEKDLIEAYANASVKLIEEMARAWYKDSAAGDCVRIKIKAEVIPDDQAMARITLGKGVIDDPSAPLHVSVWTDKKEYRDKEKMKIYIKGNKPFFAKVMHRDADGTTLQILPNPYRTENYFNGGTIYEIPSGKDQFELEVSAPFGEESIVVHASSSPLGDLDLQERGGVYQVKTAEGDIGMRTRGLKLQAAKGSSTGKGPAASDFCEAVQTVKTMQ